MSEKALKEQLLDDVHQELRKAEELIRTAGDEGGEKMRQMRERVTENLKNAKARLLDAEQVVVGRAKVAARATDDYVHDNPWKAISAAAGVGFLLGLLVSRR